MSKGKTQNPIKGLLFGLVAGAAGSGAMDLYWAAVHRIPGARPEQKPRPGDQKKDEPSTQIVADEVSKMATGHPVPKKIKSEAGVAVHYATGAAHGGLFGIVEALRPRTGLVAGLVYGVLIWLFLDELTLRLLNIAPDPKDVPVSQHLQALGAHLVYGSATALCTRLLMRLL